MLTVGGATSSEDLGLVDPSFPLTDMMTDHSHSFRDGVQKPHAPTLRRHDEVCKRLLALLALQ